MTGTPRRVTVTGPRTARPAAERAFRPAAHDSLDEVDDARMRALMRAQLRLGLVTCLSVCGALALLPVVFVLLPSAGSALSWVVLGVLVYPALVVVGWLYVRRAERHEGDFAELVRHS